MSSVSSHELSSAIRDILLICPRFRVLLVGKSGAGKSSLINESFDVSLATVSDQKHGICDIEQEITSPENPRFVLHDSQGFEPGEIGNLEKVKKFIESRGESVELKDRVHAVWLCIETPFAGGRVFETGEEEFLKLDLKVPIIVVFTKYDKLVARQEEDLEEENPDMSDGEIEDLSVKQAARVFDENCVSKVKQLAIHPSWAQVSINHKYRDTLPQLIDITQELVSKYIEGDVWIVSAMAQQASAQAKIDSSIKVGMKRYWQGLASSTHFSGFTLAQCLSAIHDEIISGWNFYDPENLLQGDRFRNKIMAFAQLVTPEASELSSWFPQSVDTINGVTGIASTLTVALSPVVAVIGLSVIFIKWITSIYQKTPEVLRCLMGYIVDLTLVMDQLFLLTLSVKSPRRVTEGQIQMALETYEGTEAPKVHRQIREYANKATFAQTLQSNNAQQKVEELIRQCRKGGTKP